MIERKEIIYICKNGHKKANKTTKKNNLISTFIKIVRACVRTLVWKVWPWSSRNDFIAQFKGSHATWS